MDGLSEDRKYKLPCKFSAPNAPKLESHSHVARNSPLHQIKRALRLGLTGGGLFRMSFDKKISQSLLKCMKSIQII